MKILSTKLHSILDYAVSIILILLPFILGYHDTSPPAMRVLICSGIFIIIYSLFTNYEYSLKKIISLKTHFALDIIQAIMLIVSPWLFGFNHVSSSPFIIIGLMEIIVVLLTANQVLPVYNKNKTALH